MTFGNLLLAALAVALITFLILISIGLITLRWRKHRHLPRPAKMDHLGRYLLGRTVVAVGVGLAFGAVLTAFLILKTERPQGDTTPSIRVQGPADRATVRMSVENCWAPAEIQLRLDAPGGVGQAAERAEVYSDQTGLRQIGIGPKGLGTFELEDPSSKRGLLSCYVGLPTVAGVEGPVRIELAMADYMKVDTLESIPAPAGYRAGLWYWDCPAGTRCPGLATVGFAFEEGAKQVTVLVLASMIGAIMAPIFAEAVLKPIRRRLDRGRRDSRRDPPSSET